MSKTVLANLHDIMNVAVQCPFVSFQIGTCLGWTLCSTITLGSTSRGNRGLKGCSALRISVNVLYDVAAASFYLQATPQPTQTSDERLGAEKQAEGQGEIQAAEGEVQAEEESSSSVQAR